MNHSYGPILVILSLVFIAGCTSTDTNVQFNTTESVIAALSNEQVLDMYPEIIYLGENSSEGFSNGQKAAELYWQGNNTILYARVVVIELEKPGNAEQMFKGSYFGLVQQNDRSTYKNQEIKKFTNSRNDNVIYFWNYHNKDIYWIETHPAFGIETNPVFYAPDLMEKIIDMYV